MAQHFQGEYNLTNGATAALYQMLQENFEREYNRRLQSMEDTSKSQMIQQRSPSVIDEVSEEDPPENVDQVEDAVESDSDRAADILS